ncbi:MAG: glycosyltransferase [Verrucomicrobiia bacterium]
MPLDLELSTAICRCLQQLGHSCCVVQDGDPAGFAADVLLVLTNLGNHPVYCRRLKSSGAKRPMTILWQLDPLPPENLPPEAEAAGLKASRWRDRFWLHQSAAAMPRWKKLCTMLRLREWAEKQCSAPGFRKASRLIQQNGGGEIDWRQVRGVMVNWRRILDGHTEGWLDHFVVSTNQRRRFLASRGITAHFIPVGAYDEMGRDLGLRRDIPVGFLGAIKHGRRAAILERLSGRLEEKGIALDRVVQGCHGEKRCEWLNRTRILVSLHHYSWNPAWIRFLLAARCGTLVVSEPMNDEHPMKAGVHYIAATVDEMPEVIGKLLDNPGKIRQVTSAAADLCHHDLTLLHAVEKLSELNRAIP